MIISENQYPLVYAVKHKNLKVRMSSRSGGVFTALTDPVIKNGGIIYGCAIDSNLDAVHCKAETQEERDAFRGSKYVQSNLGDTFREIDQYLKGNKKVIFSGTACQTSALQMFLKNQDQRNLLLIDIVCHGVPSPKVYLDYLQWMGRKKRGRVSRIEFRNKTKYGWAEHIETITINGVEYDSRIYSGLFMKNLILRPCCYRCPFKTKNHPSDITMADFWGIEKAVPDFCDNKGVSLILINNDKGMECFLEAAVDLEYRKCNYKDCIQPSLVAPVREPGDRVQFWQDYSSRPFTYIVKKYTKENWRTKLKYKLWSVYYEHIK